MEINPSFTYKIRLFVIVEDGTFELIVVGRLVYGEPEFLIPTFSQPVVEGDSRMFAYHLGVCPPRLSVSVFLASLPNRMAQ